MKSHVLWMKAFCYIVHMSAVVHSPVTLHSLLVCNGLSRYLEHTSKVLYAFRELLMWLFFSAF